MQDLLVPLLTFFSTLAFGAAVLTARAARRSRLRARLFNFDGAAVDSGDESGMSRSADLVARVGRSVSGKGPSATLRQDLAQAGYHDPASAAIYLGAKVLLFLLGLIGGLLLLPALHIAVPLKVLSILSLSAILSFVPNMVVRYRRNKRLTEVRQHLADAVDLLEICVASGMGIDMAWNSVSEEVRRVSTVLADEMALTNLEIHLGAARAVAMRHMAERTGAEELSSLVATLIQSERFGTSLTDALRTFAETMREQRSTRAEEAAEKMAVKLLFPMVLCIFPAMLIVVAGPACIELFKTIGFSTGR